MNCKFIKKIQPYIDNELEPQERKFLEAHLQTCSACHKELVSMQQLRDCFVAEQVSAPFDFINRLNEKINTEKIAEKKVWLYNIRPWACRFIPVPAFAMVLLCFMLIMQARTTTESLFNQVILGSDYSYEEAVLLADEPITSYATLRIILGGVEYGA